MTALERSFQWRLGRLHRAALQRLRYESPDISKEGHVMGAGKCVVAAVVAAAGSVVTGCSSEKDATALLWAFSGWLR